jgi:hypothetical protein
MLEHFVRPPSDPPLKRIWTFMIKPYNSWGKTTGVYSRIAS